MILILFLSLVCLSLPGRLAATGPLAPTYSRERLLALTRSSSSAAPRGVDPEFECGWRNAALKYGIQLQPQLSKRQRRDLFEALELGALCNQTAPLANPRPVGEGNISNGDVEIGNSIFVDPTKGSDDNSGSKSSPLRTLPAALAKTRASSSNTIVLRAGTYTLVETLVLTEEDSGLTISAYNGEDAVISGGLVLDDLAWRPAINPKNAFVADLSAFDLSAIPALHIDGQRATLARYPNANPERDLFPVGYITDSTSWSPPVDAQGHVCNPDTQCGVSENLTIPVDDAWHGMYQNFEIGLGGACERYTPPSSPWCSGNFYLERQFPEMHTRSPSGMIDLPSRMSEYKNASGAVVHAWRPGHWYTWMFEVANVTPGRNVTTWTMHDNVNAVFGDVPNPGSSTDTVKFLGNMDTAAACAKVAELNSSNYTAWTWHSPKFGPGWGHGCYARLDDKWEPTPQADVDSGRGPHVSGTEFTFGAGGNQGGEGSDGAGEWFVENVREELDAPNEYYYEAATKTLLYIPNATTPIPTSAVIPTLATFLDLRGGDTAAITNVTISGLTLRASRPTFMEPRGNPSGGDWALERSGAIRIENANDVSVIDNLFTHLDGNAVSINGYTRSVRIVGNEFVNLGQNAIAAWGRAEGNSGLNGIYPSQTLIAENFCHEIGHIQKQSSFYFQAETAQTMIRDNIVFNIPRAAINFNDGFGGGNEMTRNLLFNTCRESSDHGAFNSWDRLPYITTVRDGVTPSSVPGINNMHENFIVANYAADGGCLDNDDGSSYYDIHHNACIFGGHKSDFDGNKKRSFANLHLYPSVYGVTCMSIGAQNLPPKNYAEAYFNNTCVLPSAGSNYIRVPGDLKGDPKGFVDGLMLSNNTVYAPRGKVAVEVGSAKPISFEDFQKDGFDTLSRVESKMPSAEEMVKWIEALLGIL